MAHTAKAHRSILSVCQTCRIRLLPKPREGWRLSNFSALHTSTPKFNPETTPTNNPSSSNLSPLPRRSLLDSRQQSSLLAGLTGIDSPVRNKGGSLSYKPPPKPHHLHIFSTRHNCHITLTTGIRDAIISVSCGNLNFRKSARGSYDAAFQLGAFVMAKIKNMGLLDERYPGKGGPIRSLEIVLRDFGPGREALIKILMGQEGRELRQKVTRLMDASRIKFGGTRSKKPRRLG